jgi:hypothetical protein
MEILKLATMHDIAEDAKAEAEVQQKLKAQ